ncbi:uracil-DNA glycosylase [Paenisporosarcina cavernae]|uniref:Uracil-DNA glycosylase n=1 Tax=Paenisporosarcina cavernae TaxID=2320858 RepID=A0A385YTG6_9BACL|nr:uracil-DNA glycosylase [Paenisporosarcina cavernae]AYC28773.1 uracil-DNA glycosylase [Paenisporosarcina cavernae]
MTLEDALIGNDWHDVLQNEWSKPYWHQLNQFVDEEYSTHTIYPEREDIFACFRRTSFQKTSVVILGQDPYHGAGQAHGLSFSVAGNETLPPSLRNMYKEMREDIGCAPSTGDLGAWADQGVLLLNTVLTVREGQAHSHANRGWEVLTDAVITHLSEREDPVVFVLWGNFARKKKRLIDPAKNVIIEGAHPSPLSAYRGFFGSKPYSAINAELVRIGKKPITFCTKQ